MNANDINILFEDNHILVVEKPVNIPTQADSSNDLDILTLLKQYLKEKYNKPGNVYLGLVHRLDRPVGGVMVFAKTSKAASRLSELIRKHQFEKKYLAVARGKLEKPYGTLINHLLKDSKTNMVKIASKDENNAKEAILEYELLNYKDNLSLVKISLKTGRPHQIRVQFANIKHPLYGDQKYGGDLNKAGEQIALWSNSLTFEHPVTKEKLDFKLLPPKIYPWDLFM